MGQRLFYSDGGQVYDQLISITMSSATIWWVARP